ncbi:DUF4835 domain-containing protein [Fulvitalea axinellae]|uniref:DUF4835 domain-containing protein n=1 Tax=Fulvitalea axinellae TaxID=1182444 RepID=A0AAU9CEJ2_9BACT|nr:DUF4835 domain-containing protein [Fulvitalea axinellae]
MNTLRKIFLALVFGAVALGARAQELDCRVVINADNVEATDKRVFQEMERAFAEFLNNRPWTDMTYQRHERIKCNLILNVEDMPSIGNFSGTATVQAARPVFDASYETMSFYVFADKEWVFEYTESQPLEYAENTYVNNLTSLLSYYAYLIIGTHQDTFSPLGGTKYLDRARDILNATQGQQRPGWESFSGPNSRYWLVEDLLNTRMENFRKGMYDYHRKGLDIYAEKPEEAMKNVMGFLRNLKELNSLRPNSLLLRSFFQAKADELANMFSKGNMTLRKEAYEILTQVNPTESDKYEKILGK